tara:strand:+ start:843 stop:1052 length:210 start_codon:yes stop_codon:yes gene_type:complete
MDALEREKYTLAAPGGRCALRLPQWKRDNALVYNMMISLLQVLVIYCHLLSYIYSYLFVEERLIKKRSY